MAAGTRSLAPRLPSCHAKKVVQFGAHLQANILYPVPHRTVCVLAMLRKEGLIDDDFIRMIMKWRHTSGFSVHNKVRISRDDSKGQEALAQYIIRNPFSLKKVHYRQETGQVIYRSKMSHSNNKKNFQVFSVLDFIAAFTHGNGGSERRRCPAKE